MSRTLCALFLTLIFVGLFALISVYVLFASSQHPVLIASLSSSRRDPGTRPNTSAYSYIRDSLRAIQRAPFSLTSFCLMEFGTLGLWFTPGAKPKALEIKCLRRMS